MGIDRRGFLGKLAAAMTSAAAVAMVDPEQLLWTPGKKTFFLPEHVSLKRPSLLETVTVSGDAIVLRPNELARVVEVYDNGVYQPDRYVVTTRAGSVTFDSNWRPTSGFQGRPLTDVEKATLGHDMATKRTIDLKNFRME